MDNIFVALIVFIIGLISGLLFAYSYIDANYVAPMDALGIERFQKCEIKTTNCHSNWYEIVWKNDRK